MIGTSKGDDVNNDQLQSIRFYVFIFVRKSLVLPVRCLAREGEKVSMIIGKGDALLVGFCLELCEVGVDRAVFKSEGHRLPILKTYPLSMK